MSDRSGPIAFALSRQNLPTLEGTDEEKLTKGAYVIFESAKPSELILIATGSEVSLAVDAAKTLEADGHGVRVVSMPCWELFDAQDESYKNEILPKNITARLSLEAGITLGWQKYVGSNGASIGIDHFGASAPANKLFEEFGFSVANVVNTAKTLL